jgi:hypothetical protein
MRASRLVHHPESIPDALGEIGWAEYFDSSLQWGDVIFGIEAIGDVVFPVNRGHDTLANKLIRLITFDQNETLLHILVDHDWVEQIVNLNPQVRNNPSNPYYMKLPLPTSDQKNSKSYVQTNWRNRLKRRN